MHATPLVPTRLHPHHGPLRRPSAATYRRRRLTAAVAVIVIAAAVTSLLDTAAGGTTGRAVFERVVAGAIVVVWVRCAAALWRGHRADAARAARSDAESGVSCLTPDSASIVHSRRAA